MVAEEPKEVIFMEILKVENLTKIYGAGNAEVRALDGVSFAVEKGEFLAIIGPSGSGKSTLLHALGGVDRPTSGKVFMNGEDVYAQNEEQLAIFRRRHVGLIYQFYNLIPVLNVVENMTLPVRMDGRKVNEERLNELLHLLALEDRKNNLPNQLSGGQQQRVSIGRALMNAPEIVLADEPTGNLDSKNSREIVELLKLSNRKYNQTLIVITHDEQIALQADRVIAIEDGRITKDERIRRAQA
jgi:putative ABC transport system ATP-binding protein